MEKKRLVMRIRSLFFHHQRRTFQRTRILFFTVHPGTSCSELESDDQQTRRQQHDKNKARPWRSQPVLRCFYYTLTNVSTILHSKIKAITRAENQAHLKNIWYCRTRKPCTDSLIHRALTPVLVPIKRVIRNDHRSTCCLSGMPSPLRQQLM